MPHWQDWESVLLKFSLSDAQYEDVFCNNTIQQLLAKVSINVPLLIVESIIAWFIEKRDLPKNWAAAQQLRQLFDIAETLYYKFSCFCIEKAMFQLYKLACTRLRPSCILFTFNTNLRIPDYKVVYTSEIGGALVWEESTIDVGGPHAKAISIHQIPGSEPRIGIPGCQCILGRCDKMSGMWLSLWHGCYSKRSNVYVPHIWNALNQLQGASSLKEEGDQHKSVDSILENLAITDYNTVLESRLTELGEGYEQAVEACVAAVVWHHLFIEPNVRMIIPPVEVINCLIFD
ncbi:hypothetical protein SELMODRAFT_404841 [Selaginella moellendorffii]|uniref:Uncharacterized protein n=1 Tax=Selaginella moellendorffii TaxID=88036 RepID=D8QXJ0_SELML|nr:hypothetical protein SELMODRAFT_404841 [Selaginella moellendorffii]